MISETIEERIDELQNVLGSYELALSEDSDEDMEDMMESADDELITLVIGWFKHLRELTPEEQMELQDEEQAASA